MGESNAVDGFGAQEGNKKTSLRNNVFIKSQVKKFGHSGHEWAKGGYSEMDGKRRKAICGPALINQGVKKSESCVKNRSGTRNSDGGGNEGIRAGS